MGTYQWFDPHCGPRIFLGGIWDLNPSHGWNKHSRSENHLGVRIQKRKHTTFRRIVQRITMVRMAGDLPIHFHPTFDGHQARMVWSTGWSAATRKVRGGRACFLWSELGVSLQTEHLKLNVKHRDGPLQRSEQFVPLIIALQLGSPRQWPKWWLCFVGHHSNPASPQSWNTFSFVTLWLFLKGKSS